MRPAPPGSPEGLFETVLVRGGRPQLLDEHLARLRASARTLGFRIPLDRGALRRACLARAGEAEGDPARMRVVLHGEGLRIECVPHAGHAAELYRDGASAELASSRGHPLGDLAGHKVLPYEPLSRLREAARGRGAVDVVLLDRDGALLEGCASNLFLAIGGELWTPPLSRPILPGVTRAAAIRAARDLGLAVRERDLGEEDLGRARGAFLTGSLMEVLGLRALGRATWEPSPLAIRLRERLRQSLEGQSSG